MTASEAVQAEFLQALTQAVTRSAQLAAALVAEQEKNKVLVEQLAKSNSPTDA